MERIFNYINNILSRIKVTSVHRVDFSGLFKIIILAIVFYILAAPKSEVSAENPSKMASLSVNESRYAHPWIYMGTDITQVCSASLEYKDYEWGVVFNNSGPILRVTCNTWNVGYRVCTDPGYPTGDVNPFTWGGTCWIWGTNSTWDDNSCPTGYQSYYMQNGTGAFQMVGGNGCSAPDVYRRKL